MQWWNARIKEEEVYTEVNSGDMTLTDHQIDVRTRTRIAHAQSVGVARAIRDIAARTLRATSISRGLPARTRS